MNGDRCQRQSHFLEDQIVNSPGLFNSGLSSQPQGSPQQHVMTDEQFFGSLLHYSPLGYLKKGSPIFLINQQWYRSLTCIILINVFFSLVLILSFRQIGQMNNHLPVGQTLKYLYGNIAVMILTNLSYFLTQFLNPGVKNLFSITDQDYQKYGKQYCLLCHGNRTKIMNHCNQCKVCVEGLDHHCAFFNKCIAGEQKYAFYAFLLLIFISFLTLLATISSVADS